MRYVLRWWKLSMVLAVVSAVLPAITKAQHYNETILVSNVGTPPTTDINLQNPWGLVAGPGTPWWVADNASGLSTLYAISGTGTSLTASIVPINSPADSVTVLPAPSTQPPAGSPSGIVFNGSSEDFFLPSGRPAAFIFVTEDGTIQGWAGGSASTIVVDHSQIPNAKNGAVYKGATIADIDGRLFLLVANFRSGKIEMYDSSFHQVKLSEELFDDDSIPSDFAPFNIQGVGPNLYVTYAKQANMKHDPPDPGRPGDGFVDVFTRHGKLIQQLEHGPWFNAPWGVVWATPPFGTFGNTILIGNFRGDNIAAFNPLTGKFLGNMLNPDGTTLLIDGLWALRFGNDDGATGPATTLFFTAGPDQETNGLFGTLTPIASEKALATQQ
jgi:uncharacterized protein (TIGR03118 family)